MDERLPSNRDLPRTTVNLQESLNAMKRDKITGTTEDVRNEQFQNMLILMCNVSTEKKCFFEVCVFCSSMARNRLISVLVLYFSNTYGLLTKFVQSSWLDIGLVLFFACLWWDRDEVKIYKLHKLWTIKSRKKNEGNIQPS